MDVLGQVKGKDILDMGCGDGVFGNELLGMEAKSYLGIESSAKMVQLAQKNLKGKSARVTQSLIEDWTYPKESYDLVVSRLALHYVNDLKKTFENVYSSLRPEGRFVFSLLHPVITSSDKSRKDGGRRKDWAVDNYFSPGSRQVFFMGKKIEQYHRTLEDIYQFLQQAKFTIETLRESKPARDNFSDLVLFERRLRIPLFLFFSAKKT